MNRKVDGMPNKHKHNWVAREVMYYFFDACTECNAIRRPHATQPNKKVIEYRSKV
jgi:hypothetical protein